MKKVAIFSHFAFLLAVYTSPLWLDWILIILILVLYFLQIAIFGWCILDLIQFDGQKRSFHEWYLSKIGVKANRRRLKLTIRIMPFLILAVALFLQLGTNFKPFVKI